MLVTAGKDRGKTGKIVKVVDDGERVLVERINMVKRHSKPSGPQQPGGIVEKEASVHASNVMPICPKTNKPTRVGRTQLKDGVRARVARRSGELLAGS